ncbi:MAG: alpha/beta hydrolase, partial [Candidatus Omnitrophota bacterium]
KSVLASEGRQEILNLDPRERCKECPPTNYFYNRLFNRIKDVYDRIDNTILDFIHAKLLQIQALAGAFGICIKVFVYIDLYLCGIPVNLLSFFGILPNRYRMRIYSEQQRYLGAVDVKKMIQKDRIKYAADFTLFFNEEKTHAIKDRGFPGGVPNNVRDIVKRYPSLCYWLVPKFLIFNLLEKIKGKKHPGCILCNQPWWLIRWFKEGKFILYPDPFPWGWGDTYVIMAANHMHQGKITKQHINDLIKLGNKIGMGWISFHDRGAGASIDHLNFRYIDPHNKCLRGERSVESRLGRARGVDILELAQYPGTPVGFEVKNRKRLRLELVNQIWDVLEDMRKASMLRNFALKVKDGRLKGYVLGRQTDKVNGIFASHVWGVFDALLGIIALPVGEVFARIEYMFPGEVQAIIYDFLSKLNVSAQQWQPLRRNILRRIQEAQLSEMLDEKKMYPLDEVIFRVLYRHFVQVRSCSPVTVDGFNLSSKGQIAAYRKFTAGKSLKVHFEVSDFGYELAELQIIPLKVSLFKSSIQNSPIGSGVEELFDEHISRFRKLVEIINHGRNIHPLSPAAFDDIPCSSIQEYLAIKILNERDSRIVAIRLHRATKIFHAEKPHCFFVVITRCFKYFIDEYLIDANVGRFLKEEWDGQGYSLGDSNPEMQDLVDKGYILLTREAMDKYIKILAGRYYSSTYRKLVTTSTDRIETNGDNNSLLILEGSSSFLGHSCSSIKNRQRFYRLQQCSGWRSSPVAGGVLPAPAAAFFYDSFSQGYFNSIPLETSEYDSQQAMSASPVKRKDKAFIFLEKIFNFSKTEKACNAFLSEGQQQCPDEVAPQSKPSQTKKGRDFDASTGYFLSGDDGEAVDNEDDGGASKDTSSPMENKDPILSFLPPAVRQMLGEIEYARKEINGICKKRKYDLSDFNKCHQRFIVSFYEVMQCFYKGYDSGWEFDLAFFRSYQKLDEKIKSMIFSLKISLKRRFIIKLKKDSFICRIKWSSLKRISPPLLDGINFWGNRVLILFIYLHMIYFFQKLTSSPPVKLKDEDKKISAVIESISKAATEFFDNGVNDIDKQADILSYMALRTFVFSFRLIQRYLADSSEKNNNKSPFEKTFLNFQWQISLLLDIDIADKGILMGRMKIKECLKNYGNMVNYAKALNLLPKDFLSSPIKILVVDDNEVKLKKEDLGSKSAFMKIVDSFIISSPIGEKIDNNYQESEWLNIELKLTERLFSLPFYMFSCEEIKDELNMIGSWAVCGVRRIEIDVIPECIQLTQWGTDVGELLYALVTVSIFRSLQDKFPDRIFSDVKENSLNELDWWGGKLFCNDMDSNLTEILEEVSLFWQNYIEENCSGLVQRKDLRFARLISEPPEGGHNNRIDIKPLQLSCELLKEWAAYDKEAQNLFRQYLYHLTEVFEGIIARKSVDNVFSPELFRTDPKEFNPEKFCFLVKFIGVQQRTLKVASLSCITESHLKVVDLPNDNRDAVGYIFGVPDENFIARFIRDVDSGYDKKSEELPLGLWRIKLEFTNYINLGEVLKNKKQQWCSEIIVNMEGVEKLGLICRDKTNDMFRILTQKAARDKRIPLFFLTEDRLILVQNPPAAASAVLGPGVRLVLAIVFLIFFYVLVKAFKLRITSTFQQLRIHLLLKINRLPLPDLIKHYGGAFLSSTLIQLVTGEKIEDLKHFDFFEGPMLRGPAKLIDGRLCLGKVPLSDCLNYLRDVVGAGDVLLLLEGDCNIGNEVIPSNMRVVFPLGSAVLFRYRGSARKGIIDKINKLKRESAGDAAMFIAKQWQEIDTRDSNSKSPYKWEDVIPDELREIIKAKIAFLVKPQFQIRRIIVKFESTFYPSLNYIYRNRLFTEYGVDIKEKNTAFSKEDLVQRISSITSLPREYLEGFEVKSLKKVYIEKLGKLGFARMIMVALKESYRVNFIARIITADKVANHKIAISCRDLDKHGKSKSSHRKRKFNASPIAKRKIPPDAMRHLEAFYRKNQRILMQLYDLSEREVTIQRCWWVLPGFLDIIRKAGRPNWYAFIEEVIGQKPLEAGELQQCEPSENISSRKEGEQFFLAHLERIRQDITVLLGEIPEEKMAKKMCARIYWRARYPHFVSIINRIVGWRQFIKGMKEYLTKHNIGPTVEHSKKEVIIPSEISKAKINQVQEKMQRHSSVWLEADMNEIVGQIYLWREQGPREFIILTAALVLMIVDVWGETIWCEDNWLVSLWKGVQERKKLYFILKELALDFDEKTRKEVDEIIEALIFDGEEQQFRQVNENFRTLINVLIKKAERKFLSDDSNILFNAFGAVQSLMRNKFIWICPEGSSRAVLDAFVERVDKAVVVFNPDCPENESLARKHYSFGNYMVFLDTIYKTLQSDAHVLKVILLHQNDSLRSIVDKLFELESNTPMLIVLTKILPNGSLVPLHDKGWELLTDLFTKAPDSKYSVFFVGDGGVYTSYKHTLSVRKADNQFRQLLSGRFAGYHSEDIEKLIKINHKDMLDINKQRICFIYGPMIEALGVFWELQSLGVYTKVLFEGVFGLRINPQIQGEGMMRTLDLEFQTPGRWRNAAVKEVKEIEEKDKANRPHNLTALSWPNKRRENLRKLMENLPPASARQAIKELRAFFYELRRNFISLWDLDEGGVYLKDINIKLEQGVSCILRYIIYEPLPQYYITGIMEEWMVSIKGEPFIPIGYGDSNIIGKKDDLLSLTFFVSEWASQELGISERVCQERVKMLAKVYSGIKIEDIIVPAPDDLLEVLTGKAIFWIKCGFIPVNRENRLAALEGISRKELTGEKLTLQQVADLSGSDLYLNVSGLLEMDDFVHDASIEVDFYTGELIANLFSLPVDIKLIYVKRYIKKDSLLGLDRKFGFVFLDKQGWLIIEIDPAHMDKATFKHALEECIDSLSRQQPINNSRTNICRAAEELFKGMSASAVSRSNPTSTKEGFVETIDKKAKLYYKALNIGKNRIPIVFLNVPHLGFRYLYQMRALLGDYPLGFYDQHGCGNSTGEVTQDSVTIDNYVEHLRAIIEHFCRLFNSEKVTLAGHSFGGFISEHYTFKYPQRVNSLILISPPPAWIKYGFWAQCSQRVRKRWGRQDKNILNERKDIKTISSIEGYWRIHFKYYFYNLEHSKKLVIKFNDLKKAEDSLAISRFLATNLMGYDIRDKLSGIKIPVLIITGIQDVIFPLNFVQEHARYIKGAQVVSLNCGHFPSLEQTRKAAGAIKTFTSEGYSPAESFQEAVRKFSSIPIPGLIGSKLCGALKNHTRQDIKCYEVKGSADEFFQGKDIPGGNIIMVKLVKQISVSNRSILDIVHVVADPFSCIKRSSVCLGSDVNYQQFIFSYLITFDMKKERVQPFHLWLDVGLRGIKIGKDIFELERKNLIESGFKGRKIAALVVNIIAARKYRQLYNADIDWQGLKENLMLNKPDVNDLATVLLILGIITLKQREDALKINCPKSQMAYLAQMFSENKAEQAYEGNDLDYLLFKVKEYGRTMVE